MKPHAKRDLAFEELLAGLPASVRAINPHLAPVLAKAALAVGANGLFIETHPKPDEAMSDGPNMIPLGEMAAVLRSLLKIYEAAK
jgi:2-dehydro-3-deoxyphosphooctonate aldolase (KDO 8-P synthase)